MRGYADFVPLGASVQPRKSPPPPFAKGGDRGIYGLTWTVHFRDGRELQFTYPSRSTPVGSTDPYQGFTEDPVSDLKGQGLAGESLWLGVDQLPLLRSNIALPVLMGPTSDYPTYSQGRNWSWHYLLPRPWNATS